MRMAAAWVLALIFASGVTARAEPDVFMRTVGSRSLVATTLTQR